MTEEKVRKRGWVKNVAIIFLSVMLLLTFLSNTIMNRSLPEVAAQYVSSGSVTTRIRGTGTVAAVENYEVKITQSRTVQSVSVRVGDEVSVGDTLIYLSGGSSVELEAALSALDDMELAYEKAVLNASGNDYAKENRDIENAREDLAEAERARDALPVVGEKELAEKKAALDAASAAVSAAQLEEAAAQAEVDSAQEDLDALGGLVEGSGGGDYTPVTIAQNALEEAKNTLQAKKLQFGADYEKLKATAEANRGDNSLEVYMQYLSEVYSEYKDSADEGEQALYAQHVAYTEIKAAEQAVTDAQLAYDSAYAAYYGSVVGGNAYEWNRRNNILKEKKEILSQKKKIRTDAELAEMTAQSAYDELAAKKAARKTAEDEVEARRTALEDLVFALQEQQKADGILSATQALDLADQREDIEKKKAEIAELQADTGGTEVTSSVAGIVQSVSVTAGDLAVPDTALLTIEVSDRGYTLELSVTTEQSRKVKIGDTAEVSNYYWGGEIAAVLTGIRADPERPQSNKLLCFDVRGDIEAGTQLTLSIGQKSANYDMIIPNSALRSDSNGDFVLVVVAKSSPLGNRYVAQRADVTVLASDDTNTAVSGALMSGDFVITTSSAPIESGMLIRMAEG